MADFATAVTTRRVLLVLPEELVVSVRPEFEKAGWDVQTKTTGQDAINLIWGESFHALVATARLPDMRGDVLFFGTTSILPQLRTATVLLVDDEASEAIARTTGCATLAMSSSAAVIVARVEALVSQTTEPTL